MSHYDWPNHYDDNSLDDIQAKLRLAKHKIKQKLGKEEDHHIVASDAEIDSKLEVFRSIEDTSATLAKLVDEYETVLLNLARLEHAFARFLRAAADNDKSRAGRMMASVGRVQGFAAQRRLAMRGPLDRLFAASKTFRGEAVSDTANTAKQMEDARNRYRTALHWMADISNDVDPEGRLNKFRKIQYRVKQSKDDFDKRKSSVMQKVDMLAASRANMYSPALEAYQRALLDFWARSAAAYTLVARAFTGYQYYEFHYAKDLAEPQKKASKASKALKDGDKDIAGDAVVSEEEEVDDGEDILAKIDNLLRRLESDSVDAIAVRKEVLSEFGDTEDDDRGVFLFEDKSSRDRDGNKENVTTAADSDGDRNRAVSDVFQDLMFLQPDGAHSRYDMLLELADDVADRERRGELERRIDEDDSFKRAADEAFHSLQQRRKKEKQSDGGDAATGGDKDKPADLLIDATHAFNALSNVDDLTATPFDPLQLGGAGTSDVDRDIADLLNMGVGAKSTTAGAGVKSDGQQMGGKEGVAAVMPSALLDDLLLESTGDDAGTNAFDSAAAGVSPALLNMLNNNNNSKPTASMSDTSQSIHSLSGGVGKPPTASASTSQATSAKAKGKTATQEQLADWLNMFNDMDPMKQDASGRTGGEDRA